jgi:hypothetical protein
MKRAALFFIFLLAALTVTTLSACGKESDGGKKNDTAPELLPSTVRITPIPQGVETFNDIEITISGEKLPLYSVQTNRSQVWSPIAPVRRASAVGYFELRGRCELIVKLPYDIDYSSKLRPLAAGITPVADKENRTLRAVIYSPGDYVLEPNGSRFEAVHLFVSELKDEEYRESSENVVYFGSGLHTAQNSELIDEHNRIFLTSGKTVYLARGAVVRAKITAANASDIKVAGHGILDGSVFPRNATTGEVTVPIDINHSSRVTLSDFSALDPAGWCVNFYFNTDSVIDGIKIISSRSNGDGISLQSCKNIAVKNCFVRSWDDSLVVKNYPLWQDRSVHGATQNIEFSDCIIWTDLAQSMEIGYETVGEKLEGVSFKNITVLHALHKPVISVHNGNNAEIKDVAFENITVEDASMGLGDAGQNNQLIEIVNIFSPIWSESHAVTSLGSIESVTVKKIKVVAGNKIIPIKIAGTFDSRPAYQSEHWVRNIALTDIEIKGKVISDEYDYLSYGSYTEGITVSSGTASGANYKPKVAKSDAAAYTTAAQVVFAD